MCSAQVFVRLVSWRCVCCVSFNHTYSQIEGCSGLSVYKFLDFLFFILHFIAVRTHVRYVHHIDIYEMVCTTPSYMQVHLTFQLHFLGYAKCKGEDRFSGMLLEMIFFMAGHLSVMIALGCFPTIHLKVSKSHINVSVFSTHKNTHPKVMVCLWWFTLVNSKKIKEYLLVSYVVSKTNTFEKCWYFFLEIPLAEK